MRDNPAFPEVIQHLASYQYQHRKKSRRMKVWRNKCVSSDSFRALLETLEADKCGHSTITSLHLHNVSFDSLRSNSNKRGRSEMTEDNLIGPPQCFEISIVLCSLDVHAALVMGPVFRAILHSKVTTLKIANSKMSVEFVDLLKTLFEQKCFSLKNIHLQNIHMEEEHKMNELLLALHNAHKLQVLHLEKCGLETANSSHLAALIRAQEHLVSLDVSKNNLDDSALKILLELGIAQHPSLTSLVLSENPIGDEGAVALSEILSSTEHTNLRSLSLCECEIWDEGCRVMSSDMARFRTLKELFIDGNWGEHLGIIANSLRNNMVLTQLWMPQQLPEINDCDDTTNRSWSQIQYYLRLNRAKRKTLLNVPMSSSTWVSTLARGNKDVDLVFHLLRARPAMANLHRLYGNEGTLVCG
jgi:hypothetical protein